MSADMFGLANDKAFNHVISEIIRKYEVSEYGATVLLAASILRAKTELEKIIIHAKLMKCCSN